MKKKKIFISILFCFIFLAISILFLLVEEGIIFNELKELMENSSVWNKIIRIIDSIVIGALLVILSNFVLYLGNIKSKASIKTFALLLGNVAKYVSVIGVILAILSILGVDTTTLVTTTGILTLIVGLGCQSLVADIVAGIFMIIEGDIQVGDVVVINGWRGTVKQIGLRRTKIVDTVGNVNLIVNSSIQQIINNTEELSYAICVVGIEYNESIERVESIFADHIKEFKERIPAIVEGPYYKGVQELGDSSVKIKIIAKVKEIDKFQVERDINREIKLLFEKNNINIPFNQVVVNYRDKDDKQVFATKDEIAKANKFRSEQEVVATVDEQQ